MNRLRILLADDHVGFLYRVVGLLEPDFNIVGVVADGAELLAEARRRRPDIIVLDISMPLMDGIAAATQLHVTNPATKLVFLTVEDRAEFVRAGMAAGASGYVIKSRLTADLKLAIREVVDGHNFISPGLRT